MRRKKVLIAFSLTMTFFVCLFGLFSLIKKLPSHDRKELIWHQNLYKLEEQIEELTQIQESYLERADSDQKQAEKLSSEGKQNHLIKRYLRLVKANKNIAIKLQEDLDRLIKKKQTLLDEDCHSK